MGEGQGCRDGGSSLLGPGRYETWRSSLLLPSGVVLTQHGHGLVEAQGCYSRNFIQKKGTAVVILQLSSPSALQRSTCPRSAQTLFASVPAAGLGVKMLGCGSSPTLPLIALSHNVACPLFHLGVEPAWSNQEAGTRTGPPPGHRVSVTIWLHGEW